MNFFEKKSCWNIYIIEIFFISLQTKNQLITIKIKDIWQKPISIFAKNITLSEGQAIRMYVSVTKTAHGILYAFI